MINRLKRQGGFTLIELMVSSVIVTILGMTSWYAANTLIVANDIVHNSITAVNLQRKSQEEIRRVIRSGNNYDILGTLGICDFSAVNICGFEGDLSTSFPGFSRTMTVTNEAGSSEFKRVVVTVTWNELGKIRISNTVELLSRPPQPMPGNLIGKVTDSTTGNNLGSVDITASLVSAPGTLQVVSTLQDILGKLANYTFANAAGQSQMTTGNWNISAKRNGYQNYVGPAPVVISANIETQFDFAMIPVPDNATITVTWPSGVGLPYTPKGTVALYKKGSLQTQSNANFTGSHIFTVQFIDTNPQCFTVATNTDIWKNGFVGNFTCSSPPMTQDSRGWSSAVVRADNSLVCGNPWVGNATSDRICVNPGDAITVALPVVPVATTNLTGEVKDSNNLAIAGASLVIRWHDNGEYPWTGKALAVTTDSAGKYAATVPAEQNFFNDANDFYIRTYASASVPMLQCCNISGTVQASPGMIRVGPLTAGVNKVQDYVIDTTPQTQTCGGANGLVIDGSTLSGLSGAKVGLSGSKDTDAIGNYQFQCPDLTLMSVPAKAYYLNTTKANYYDFTTKGNNYYTQVGTGKVIVNKDVGNIMPNVELWPKGVGTLNVNVVGPGGSSQIQGATVSLVGTASPAPVLSAPAPIVTGANGLAVFNALLETWPPPSVVGNVKYQQTVSDYTITVNHPSYETAVVGNVKLDRNQTLTQTINLILKAGM